MAAFYEGMYCSRCGEREMENEGINHWYCRACDTHFDTSFEDIHDELEDYNLL